MLLILPLALAADPPVDWIADEAVYHLRVTDTQVVVRGEYHFRPVGGGFAVRTLVGPGMLVQEAPSGVLARDEGLVIQLGPGLRQDVSFEGTLDSTSASVSLGVLPAVRQRVEIDAPGLEVTVDGAVGGVLAQADHLDVRWEPVHARPALAPLVHAEVGTAAWGQDGALAVHAVVRWNVVRGAVDELRMGVTGLTDVELSGANVARWERVGDEVIVTPAAPVRGRLSVDVTARAALPHGNGMPAPTPDAARVDRWWVLGRSDEGELIPGAGPETVTRRIVPTWARALSETQPLAYWHGAAPVPLEFAKYDAVSGPDTIIPRATVEAVTNEDGRIFVRTTLRVRNERRQYLHVTPPPGFSPFGARVSGQPVILLDDGGGGLYVPLEKSIESVRGLVTFPVELLWVGETGAFEKKGERTFQVPAVDAPIQQVDWQIHLPRGFSSKDERVVAVTTEAPLSSVTNALTAYRQNKFDEAQQWLDHAKAAGGESDEDVQALQSNLDVLNRRDVKEDSSTRRVRDLANAKNVDLELKQAEVEKEAERALRSGDLEKAEELYDFVEQSANQLALTEQEEAAEQKDKKAEVKGKRKELAEKRKVASAQSKSGSFAATPKAEPAPEQLETLGYVVGRDGDGVVDTPDVAEDEVTYAAPVEIAPEMPAAAAPVTSTTVAGISTGREFRGAVAGKAAPAPQTRKTPAASEPAKPANIPQPPRDLSAHAAPMTLALPLDGWAVGGHEQLLQPNQFPQLTVHYRGPR